MVLDTRSVHVAAGVPASTTGHDPAKRVPGRKRALAVDILGPVIAVVVLAANTHDDTAGIKDICEALGHELLPKNVERTRAKLKRLVTVGILTEADTGNLTGKQ